MRTPATLAAVVLLLMASCARTGAPSDSGDEPSVVASALGKTSKPIESATPSKGSGMNDSVHDAILGPIVADASRRTGIDENEIELIRGEAVTWTDGSLGCPEPGMMYTQALVDGYHVVLEAAGQELDYRVDRSGGFRLCENPTLDGGRLPSE